MENTEKSLVVGIDYKDQKTLSLLKQTVAKDATDAEFQMFLQFAKSTGLNPFKKELWFLKANGQVQMMTGINGFYSIANSHPMFDGIETELFFNPDKTILKAVSKTWRKDRKYPSTAEAYWVEYAKPYGNWKTMGRVMISKCAESMSLRKAFPQEMNGLYTQEEMPAEYAPNHNVQPVQQVRPVQAESVTVAEAQDIAAEAPQEIPNTDYPDSAVVGNWSYRPPFKMKDEIKKMGARWNPENKTWDSPHEIPSFRDFLFSSPIVEKAAKEVQAVEAEVVPAENYDDIPF